VVLVPDHQGDGGAGGEAAAQPGDELGGVALDLHPAAAAVALLAAPQLGLHPREVDGHPGREALGDGAEPGPM
jgi:hypothetical protein